MATLFGLTKSSTNEEIREMAFQKVKEERWMSFSTVGSDGLPSVRAIDFNLLSDGNIYFETEAGKAVYSDLVRTPVGALCALIRSGEKIHDIVMLRMKVSVEPVDLTESIVDEFFELNPGTMSLFTKAPEVMKLFRIVAGQGELFQTYQDDAVDLLRFTFGDIAPEPARYYVEQSSCISCGQCVQVCNHNAISCEQGYRIDPLACLKCGACYSRCPSNSIKCRENETWGEVLNK